MKAEQTIMLAVDGCHGMYIPQRFFKLYPEFISYLNDDDRLIIDDPDHENYWDVWDDFVSSFNVVKDGVRWFLHLDDDVFFVREHHNFNE